MQQYVVPFGLLTSTWHACSKPDGGCASGTQSRSVSSFAGPHAGPGSVPRQGPGGPGGSQIPFWLHPRFPLQDAPVPGPEPDWLHGSPSLPTEGEHAATRRTHTNRVAVRMMHAVADLSRSSHVLSPRSIGILHHRGPDRHARPPFARAAKCLRASG